MKAEEKVIVLLQALHERKQLDPYDTILQEKLEIGQKQLLRDLRSLSAHFDNIVEIKEGRRIVFRLLRPIDILVETYLHHDDLGILWHMARESMPEILETFNRISQKADKPYRFFHMPYEDIDTLQQSPVFLSLKRAVERHEYRDIVLKGKSSKRFEAVKPLKLLFSEGNWYVAYIDDKELRISRIGFIREVRYTKNKANFKPSSLAPYKRWLEERFQNPFSRYGREIRYARLKASAHIAHYFQKEMKPFFASQRFIEADTNGSVVFEVAYSQPMEILPFVRKWLPHLTILSPESLKALHIRQLTEALAAYD